MNARIPSIARPMQVAAAIVFGLGVAASGGAAAGGPMRGAAGGPVGGPPGAPGGMIEHVLASMKDRLALDSSQQVMFDRIRAQTVAAHDQASAMRADVRAKVDAELAKAEPDLAAVSAFFDNAEEQGAPRGARFATSGSRSTPTCAPTRRRSCATRSVNASPAWTTCTTACGVACSIARPDRGTLLRARRRGTPRRRARRRSDDCPAQEPIPEHARRGQAEAMDGRLHAGCPARVLLAGGGAGDRPLHCTAIRFRVMTLA